MYYIIVLLILYILLWLQKLIEYTISIYNRILLFMYHLSSIYYLPVWKVMH